MNEPDAKEKARAIVAKWKEDIGQVVKYERMEQDIASAAITATKRDDWQPIETAPLETAILVWVPINASIFAVYHFDVLEPWRLHTAKNRDILPASWKPTHWTPLPKPPIASELEKE